jgi:hypothetical protein
MDSSSSIIPYLFLVTFVLVIAAGVWQYFKARKAKDQHEQSADARVHGDAPGPSSGSTPRSAAGSSQVGSKEHRSPSNLR